MSFTIIALTLGLQVCVIKQEAKLTPSVSSTNAFFGLSIDIKNDRMAIGAPGQAGLAGGLRGAVFVFDRIAGNWTETAAIADALVPNNGDPNFGAALSLDGDQIAIGAPDAWGSVPSSRGLAFVFEKSGNSWIEEAVFDPGILTQYFGSSVDLDGDMLAVGAPINYAVAPYVKPGMVFVYVRGPSGWSTQSTLYPNDVHGEHAFGSTVKLNGDVLLVGSARADGLNPTTGAVYVYKRSGANWNLQQKITASDGQEGDNFGAALSLGADTLLVGAPQADVHGTFNAGAAYLFQKQAGTWTQHGKLVSPSYWAGVKFFGPYTASTVALDGDVLAFGEVGAEYAHIAMRHGANWLHELQFQPPDKKPADNFGRAVGLSLPTLAVGSPFADVSGQDTGAVYVYRVQSGNVQPRYYCTPSPAPACLTRIYDVGQPSVSGAMAGEKYQVRTIKMRDNVLGMLVYSTTGPASTPFQGGILCVNPPVKRTHVQSSLSGPTLPCTGGFVTDVNALIKNGFDPALKAGQQVWFQYWFRDPALVPLGQAGLTAGVTAIICP